MWAKQNIKGRGDNGTKQPKQSLKDRILTQQEFLFDTAWTVTTSLCFSVTRMGQISSSNFSSFNWMSPTTFKSKVKKAFQLQNRDYQSVYSLTAQKESVSYWTLHVTVLTATCLRSEDVLSASDCYVVLSLPTATARNCRTKTVNNNNNPEWNESFTFRVPIAVKNVLQIKLFDEDLVTGDDLISTVMLDISTIDVGKKEHKVFTVNPELPGELVMDFELLQSKEPACEYLTNGILMAAPFCALDICVDKLQMNACLKDKVLQLMGAYEANQTLDLQDTKKVSFYINRDLETELKLVSHGANTAISDCQMATSVAFHPLQANQVSLHFDEDTVDLELQRGSVTSAKVPTIAVVASGGGSRAMTSLLGSLRALKELGVLDAVTYITGVSGSIWTMSALYQNANWSHQDMNEIISALEKGLTSNKWSYVSPKRLNYYNKEMKEKENEGHLVSLVDMWGLLLEQFIFGKKITTTLSDQQRTIKDGQNPLPIYTAVNVNEGIHGCEPEMEWCEFTPYEVGMQKYGAFVRAEDLGSQFFIGRITRKFTEMRLPYLLGLWSSVFSVNLSTIWEHVTGSKPSWLFGLGPDVSIVDTHEPSTLDTYVVNPMTEINKVVTNFFTSRPVAAQMYNFMHGFSLRWNYSKSSNFNAMKETHPDAFSHKLCPSDSTLCLVDSGNAINIGCPPILREERDVDLIVCLSYSWDEDILEVLSQTAAYCKDHNLPFPNADFSKVLNEPRRECYIFEDEDNPKAPIVIHFPLVNITYKRFSHPGKLRMTEEEIKAGNVDVSSDGSPYTTGHLTFSKEDFEALVDLTSYNILCSKDKLLETLQIALERKANK
ncbi:cytosolic phospholipase A2 zeta isoform X2 [Genypterus blacodes]|uniref:cytosolic phospholipase A2 zeta isoform X2 n=1 Tax=Genypterus blacodes TaxID=154954 RepID=UPI003F75940F